MRLSFTAKLSIFYLIIAIGMGVLAYNTYSISKQNIKDHQWVTKTHDALLILTRIRALTKDNALYCSQYLITGDTVALILINNQKKDIYVKIDELSIMTKHNLVQQKSIKQLKATILQSLTFTDSILSVYSSSGKDEALKFYANGKGIQLTQKIRDIVAHIENTESHLLADRQKEFSKSQVSFWVSVSLLAGITMLMITVMLLITNKQIKLRRIAEEELKTLNIELENRVVQKTKQVTDEQKRYQTLLDNMMEGIQIISYNWEYLYLNDAATKQSKYTKEELIGYSMMDKYPLKDNPRLYDTMKQCMETKKPARFDNFFKYPDGTTGYFDLSIEPIKEGLFILSMDISERMKREIEKERRIEDAKEILNKISHDIRQPVSSILGVSNLLEASIISEDEMKMISASMRESAILLDQRTRNLTDYVSSLRNTN